MTTNPIESKQYPGFFKIPGYKNFGISKENAPRIINFETGEIVSQFRVGDYLRVHTEGEFQRTSAVHRLVALTFCYNPNPKVNIVVDHVDGNKQNNSPSNLEWVTYQENTERAGNLGLTSKCVPIQVRNSKTGEIREYRSCIEFARQMDYPKDSVLYRLKHGQNGAVKFLDGFQYRKRSTDPWPVKKICAAEAKKIDVRDLKTGEIFHYDNLTQLTDLAGMKLPALWTNMNQRCQPVFKGRYQFKYAAVREWREPGDLILESTRSCFKRPVQVYNPAEGYTIVFQSCVECAAKMRLGVTTLNWRLKSGGKTIYNDGFVYGYYPLASNMSVPYENMGLKCYLNLENLKAYRATAQLTTANANA